MASVLMRLSCLLLVSLAVPVGAEGATTTPPITMPPPPPSNLVGTTTMGDLLPQYGTPMPPSEPEGSTGTTPANVPASTVPPPTDGFPEVQGTMDEKTVEEIFNEQCAQPATISMFCVLPENLKAFLSPDAVMADIGQYLISDAIVSNLTRYCKPGTWCLSSETSEIELQDKLNFWTNASDFNLLCWPDLAVCLDYISDFYFDCESYESSRLITAMYSLLCKMKEEPKASPDCIRETIKTLHVSMADSKRTVTELEASELAPQCDSRRSRMGKNFLCTTAMCNTYSALLYEFEPWKWLTDNIEDLKKECDMESLECVTRADENTMDDLLSSMIKDEEKVYEKNWILEKVGLRAVIVIAIMSVIAMGAFSLLFVVVWRKRQMRVRVRDGMEYLEIKPEETEAFLEGFDEIGDSTKLVGSHK